MKIVFMGTPDFARESLEALYSYGHEILAVVTNPDRPKGRGMKLITSEVKDFAISNKIKIFQPEKIRNNTEFINEIKKLNPDIICVVAYGKIIPIDILDIPEYGCINVHGSLLPKYRGAAPIQWSIIDGEEITGITTMYMDVGMDTGDMILKKEVEIGEDETTGELWSRLSKIGSELLIETLDKIKDGTAPRQKQGEVYTLAPMLNKDMAKINWEEFEAKKIKNLVRGLNPIMGAYTFLNNKKIKIWKVNDISKEMLLEKFPELKEYEYRLKGMDAGTVLFSDNKTGLYIKTIDGAIEVLEIQGENSRKMNIHDFLRGTNIDIGSIFE